MEGIRKWSETGGKMNDGNEGKLQVEGTRWKWEDTGG